MGAQGETSPLLGLRNGREDLIFFVGGKVWRGSMDFFAKCGIMEIYSDIFLGRFKCPLFSDFENGKDIGV